MELAPLDFFNLLNHLKFQHLALHPLSLFWEWFRHCGHHVTEIGCRAKLSGMPMIGGDGVKEKRMNKERDKVVWSGLRLMRRTAKTRRDTLISSPHVD